MSAPKSLRLVTWAAAALACLSALPAHAAQGRLAGSASTGAAPSTTFIDVNLTGFQSVGDFGDPGNTTRLLSLGAGTTITSWDFINLSFTTQGTSWLSEFVLSVNNSDASEYLDGTVSDVDAGGTFGPSSGSFGVDTPLLGGAPFVAANGSVLVTVYETFDDTGIDAVVSSGTLRIYYTASAVPEPGTYGLMGLGALAVVAAARRRRAA